MEPLVHCRFIINSWQLLRSLMPMLLLNQWSSYLIQSAKEFLLRLPFTNLAMVAVKIDIIRLFCALFNIYTFLNSMLLIHFHYSIALFLYYSKYKHDWKNNDFCIDKIFTFKKNVDFAHKLEPKAFVCAFVWVWHQLGQLREDMGNLCAHVLPMWISTKFPSVRYVRFYWKFSFTWDLVHVCKLHPFFEKLFPINSGKKARGILW